MSDLIQSFSNWLWGLPMLTLVLGTGIYLIVRLRAVQAREFVPALKLLFTAKKDGAGDITPFAALMTAVGGIVGNGNLAGVATAVTAGGPGALFWMWISGVVGMGTMFAESVLGVQYRKRDAKGLFVGGPMFYLRDGLGWPRVAAFFAFGLAIKTLFATTIVQSNSIASVVSSQLGWRPLTTCLLLAGVCGLAIIGGVRSVALTSEILAPLMGVLYLTGAAVVLVTFRHEILPSLQLVVHHAFSPVAASGGFLGAGVREAFRFGVARGVYSNEAGTGSVPIAHASAQTNNPVRQGKVAMLGVFIDTLVVSTATGLALLVTGAWQSGLDSTALTARAFSDALGAVGGPLVLVCSVLFGLSTLITWSFYGEQSAAYLFGPRARPIYRVLYCSAIAGGAIAGPRLTWAWADILNGMMAIPNLIALLAMAGGLAKLMRSQEHSAKDST